MNTLHEGYYIGLMTGTSMDGVDTVLVDLQDNNKTRLIASYEQPLTDDLRDKIIGAGNTSADSLHDIALLDQELAEIYATCIQSLLKQSGIKAGNVPAIGSHGQTIRQWPDIRFRHRAGKCTCRNRCESRGSTRRHPPGLIKQSK